MPSPIAGNHPTPKQAHPEVKLIVNESVSQGRKISRYEIQTPDGQTIPCTVRQKTRQSTKMMFSRKNYIQITVHDKITDKDIKISVKKNSLAAYGVGSEFFSSGRKAEAGLSECMQVRYNRHLYETLGHTSEESHKLSPESVQAHVYIDLERERKYLISKGADEGLVRMLSDEAVLDTVARAVRSDLIAKHFPLEKVEALTPSQLHAISNLLASPIGDATLDLMRRCERTWKKNLNNLSQIYAAPGTAYTLAADTVSPGGETLQTRYIVFLDPITKQLQAVQWGQKALPTQESKEFIGAGTNAVVQRTTIVATEKFLALKAAQPYSHTQTDVILEAATVRTLHRHGPQAGIMFPPHAVIPLGAARGSDWSLVGYLTVQYSGDMSVLVDRELSSKEEGLRVAHQLLSGLTHCHRMGNYHGDIKPKNIFILPDPSGQIHAFLGDFGGSEWRQHVQDEFNTSGNYFFGNFTALFASKNDMDLFAAFRSANAAIPREERQFNPAIFSMKEQRDIFSLGYSLIQTLGSIGTDPESQIPHLVFPMFRQYEGGIGFSDPSQGLTEHGLRAIANIRTKYGDELADLLLRMTHENPSERPSASVCKEMIERAMSAEPGEALAA